METWAVAAAVAVVFLALVGGAPGAWEAERKVPPPTNVTIESYNFNTSVHWDYEGISSEPLFVVEITCYGDEHGVYTEISSCVNISQHYCDLTHKVESCHKFWIRVKALDGPQKSEYTESKQFSIMTDVRIGPPKVNLSLVADDIIVDIEHPLTPYRKKRKGNQLSVRRNFTDLAYIVSYWKNGSQPKKHKTHKDQCSSKKCTTLVRISLWNILYCVSVHGTSKLNDVKGEESKESCIFVPSKHQSDLTVPITLGVVALVLLVLILVAVFACTQKKKIKLPKSLASMIRSHVSSFETNSESNNVSCITSASYIPVLSECKDEKSPEQVDFLGEVKSADFGNCVKEVDPCDSQGTSSKTGEMSTKEDMIVDIPEGEQSLEDSANYFKSISGQEEMDDNLSNVDFPKADVQQPPRCRNISGYDKPHWKNSVSSVDSVVT